MIGVAPSLRLARCGGCGCRVRRAYDRRTRTWRHLDFGEMTVHLRYDLRRVECPRCGVTTELVPWAEPGSWFTREFELLAAYLAQHTNKTLVSTLLRVAWATVGNIVGRVVDRLRPRDVFDGVTSIGVDELSYRKHHAYITVVVDHDRGRIIWARPGKNADTLKAFFADLGAERCARLHRVSIDMSPAYEKAVREAAPNAEVVFDRFHVQRLIHDALDRVRREEVASAQDPEARRALKKTRYALQKRPWNLNEADGVKLAMVQRHNRRLYRAHLLKETLASILDGEIRPAATKLQEWISWARHSQLAPFAKAAATVRDHVNGILAYCESGLTNAVVEALNGRARVITRSAFGFHGPNSLIAMLFLCCGGIRLSPPYAGVHP
jgi:transposase